MTNRLMTASTALFVTFLPAVAGAQALMETYRAEIAAVDRRNSSGVVLADPAAILAQDRANVHRFGQRQAGDTVDGVFSVRERRAAMATLLARGSISPSAQRALDGRGGVVLDVGIWGGGGTVSHVTVDVAAGPEPQAAGSADPPLTEAEIARDAPRIQSALNARGFDAGPVDGQPGRRTRDAVAAFQLSLGRAGTGALTRSEWEILQAVTTTPGPSFDCTRAGTPAERAICANPALAVLDRALAEAWRARRQVDGSDALLVEQRRWIAGRDACGSDVICLEQATRERVAVLGGELPAPSAAPVADLAVSAPGEPGGAMAVAGEGGLITVDGRVLYSLVDANALALTESGSVVREHEQELARHLALTARAIGSDDLAATLADTPNPGYLRTDFDLLPRAAQDEIVRLGLSISNVTDIHSESCLNRTRGPRLSCATQRLETTFDQRRFQQGAAEVIARTVEESRLDVPLPVRVFCPLGPIDQAYDFDTGTVDWASMIENGCHLNDPGVDLGGAVPERTEMEAARVEDLARRYLGTDAQGSTRIQPLMLAFDGELRIERQPGAQAGPDGVVATTQALRRTGPVGLRWSGTPGEEILRFDAPSGNRPAEAVDLRLAGPAARLIDGASALDTARLGTVLADPAALRDGLLVRLPALPTDGAEPVRLSIANFFLPEVPAQQVAAQTGEPLEHVAWTQLISNARGVPDTELVLIFTSPYAALGKRAHRPRVRAAAQSGRRGPAGQDLGADADGRRSGIRSGCRGPARGLRNHGAGHRRRATNTRAPCVGRCRNRASGARVPAVGLVACRQGGGVARGGSGRAPECGHGPCQPPFRRYLRPSRRARRGQGRNRAGRSGR
ncbi:peptidoglycan-binding protein [Jannaschia marina]|uniref:peptidoglycan-binding protein n=1 Tax=Jannaschia marina TaxID=2741674 RepID=UPI0015C8B7D3|nr:peptidoglycan-binding protein [Jannaschia marina]